MVGQWQCMVLVVHAGITRNEHRHATDSPNADMVVEGQDQYRGWLQSLLWTAAGAHAPHTPFAGVVVHGFVVDGENRKMSKSVGNVVDPMHILVGCAEQKMPVCGIDALR